MLICIFLVLDFLIILLVVGLCKSSDKYYSKCYCPGKEKTLATSQFKELRDLMYVKRREYTNADPGFPPIYEFPGK